MDEKQDSKRVTRRNFLTRAVVYGTLIGTAAYQLPSSHRLTLERHTLKVPKWDADGLKVGLVSDVHINSARQAERAIRALKMAADHKVDLIAIPGDFTNSEDHEAGEHIQQFLDAAGDLGIPVFATPGNHDYWLDDAEPLFDRIRASKIEFLRNEVTDFQGINLAGIDDGVMAYDKHDFLEDRHDRNTLALFHEPDFVERVDPRISVMLAGHSHGGQICLPGGRHLRTPRGARTYIKGFYPDAKVPLYVSRGVGTSGPDLRAFCPPEVSILTLESA